MFNKLIDKYHSLADSLFKKPERRIRMDAIAYSLNNTTTTLGSVYGPISQSLDELDEKTKRLRQDCQVLIQSAGGQDEGTSLLFRTADTLQGPTSFLGECISKQDLHCELMQRCETTANGLLDKQTKMVAALEPLRFMLVFFKIEASQLTEADRQTFHSVSEEISHLHVLVDQAFHRNIQNLDEAREKIRSAQESTRAARERQSAVVRSRQKDIQEAISNLRAQIESNSHKTTDLDKAAKCFEDSTSLLVMSLQYEDIIRQRCEHIIKELDNKPPEIRNATWLLYQAKQIETTAEEIRQSSSEIRRGLQEVDAHGTRLLETSTTMEQYDHITASADGMIQTLLDSLENIKEMLEQSTELSQSSCDAIAPVQTLTQELSEIVFEVSIKIQFIALNAQVRSIQVGDGSGLEVLAARTAEISAQLRDLGEETSREIDELHSIVNTLVSSSREEYEEGSKQLAIIIDTGNELETELHRMRDSTLASLDTVGKLATRVSQFTKNDVDRLKLLDLQANELIQRARTLRTKSKFNSLSKRERSLVEAELRSLVGGEKDAMHNRLHDEQSFDETSFDLAISQRATQRTDSHKALEADNVEFF